MRHKIDNAAFVAEVGMNRCSNLVIDLLWFLDTNLDRDVLSVYLLLKDAGLLHPRFCDDRHLGYGGCCNRDCYDGYLGIPFPQYVCMV